MLNVFRNRKFVAILMSFLMIMFLLPTAMSQFNHVDPLVGKLAGKKVYASQFDRPRIQATEIIRVLENARSLPQATQEGLARIIQFPQLVYLLREHPEALYLLAHEAEKMGIHISPIEHQQAVEAMGLSGMDSDRRGTLIAAAENLLKVRAAFDRVGSAVKVTTPMIAHARAEQFQRINLGLVEFKADDFLTGVPTPGEDDLKKQFDAYADTIAGTGDPKTNPFGFGYKYPDRVKIQWIDVPQAELVNAARKTKSDYDWTVEAQKEYQQNPQRYPSTQPAEEPTFKTGLEQPKKPAAPTTRPFAEVREQIVDKLVRDQAGVLRGQVLNKINAILNSDWVAYQKDRSKPTPLGAAYDKVEYLEKIREVVLKDFGLSVTVESIGSLRSHEQIAGSADMKIASAAAGERVSFVDALFGGAEAFIPADQKEKRFGLKIMQPSAVVHDALSGDAFVYRITEASPAHKPEGLAEVREQVELNLRRKLAYTQAEEAAKAFLEQAKGTDLATAASAEKKKIISTEYFDKGRQTQYGAIPPMIKGYNVPTEATDAFVNGAFGLLRTATAAQPKSKDLIALPRTGVALAAELEGVQSVLPEDGSFMINLMLSRQLQYQQVLQVLGEWFSWDNIVARTDWQPEERKKSEESEPAPARPTIPLGQ